MHHFFTTESTAPPAISVTWYSVMVLFVVTAIMMSLRYYQNEQFRKCFQYLQGFQLICLYLGILPTTFHGPIAYHFIIAVWPCLRSCFYQTVVESKQFFALMGVSGAIFALGYPVFDPYTFPHITSFSFLLGHYCLLINSLIYLLRWYDRNLLKNSQIVLYTFALDLFLVGVNQLTGGNYGLMARPPIMRGDKVWLNYLVVSSILALALLLL